MPKGHTLDEFRKKHDQSYIVPERIKAGLKQLGDSWLPEHEFMKLCGIGPPQISKYREQFAAHIVELHVSRSQRNKRAWAGTTKLAAKLRSFDAVA